MPTLAQTQHLLWQLVTAPEGAAAGLAALPVADRATCRALVRGDERLGAIERIEIYADMYFYRLRDALKEDFGALCAVIGETGFHNLITDYLLVHPPSHFSLRYAGQCLPAFVRTHVSAQRRPYLADLATLEWAILDAFDAPDAAPLDAAELARVPAERWPALRLKLTPTLQLLQLDWPVHTLWEAAQRREPPSEPVPQPTALRVWRQDFRVFHQPIDAAECAALRALAEGAAFADACERMVRPGDPPAEHHPSNAAEHAANVLRQWLADDVLVGFSYD
jgi:putative DNA-binding protein